MIACPSCGGENVEGTRFCVKCGTTLPIAPAPESWRSSGGLGQQPGTPAGGSGQSGPIGGGYAQGSQSGGYAPPDPYAVPAPGWQPQQGMMAGRGGGLLAIGEKREPITVVVYIFLTCGIYALIWWYTIMTEIKNALGREDINPGMEILFVFLSCGIYGFYLYYKYSQLMLEMQDRAGKPRNDISMTALLLAIFGLAIVSIPIMQTELNSIWDAASRR